MSDNEGYLLDEFPDGAQAYSSTRSFYKPNGDELVIGLILNQVEVDWLGSIVVINGNAFYYPLVNGGLNPKIPKKGITDVRQIGIIRKK